MSSNLCVSSFVVHNAFPLRRAARHLLSSAERRVRRRRAAHREEALCFTLKLSVCVCACAIWERRGIYREHIMLLA